MPRRKFIAGNWKMYNGPLSASKYLTDFSIKLNNSKELLAAIKEAKIETALFVPAISIESAIKATNGVPIIIGAQNVHYEANGAYTGEISVPMLKETDCTHVIIGHSERRHIFNENDIDLNKKVKATLSGGLIPVYCVGELLEERESGKTFDVVRSQLTSGLKGLDSVSVRDKVIIAYEPVWAIGTGRTASADDAQEVCAFIRKVISDTFGEGAAAAVIILYGGSVKPENTRALISENDIDGALVGGASLNADTFIAILSETL